MLPVTDSNKLEPVVVLTPVVVLVPDLEIIEHRMHYY